MLLDGWPSRDALLEQLCDKIEIKTSLVFQQFTAKHFSKLYDWLKLIQQKFQI